MHELSIAISIIDTVKEQVIKEKASKVFEIVLEIGKLSGIIIDALSFALEETNNSEMFSNTKYIYKSIEGRAVCNHCQTDFIMDDFFDACPNCLSYDKEIYQGKDLIIKSLSCE